MLPVSLSTNMLERKMQYWASILLPVFIKAVKIYAVMKSSYQSCSKHYAVMSPSLQTQNVKVDTDNMSHSYDCDELYRQMYRQLDHVSR